MRSIKIMLPLLVLMVFIIGLPRAGAQNGESTAHRIEGNYQVVVKPDHYPGYTTIVRVTQIDAQRIKLSGTYEGIPLTVLGVLRNENVSSGMDTYDVVVRNSLFSGKVVLNFQPVNKECSITGFGSGKYNYLGLTGSATATITGVNSQIHFSIGWIMGVLLLIGVGTLIFWLGQRRHPTGR